MKNNLTCEIVRDLLPSYVDGLTNDVSNQAVEQHIKICENCQKLYHEMQETVNGEYLSEQDLEQMGQKANFKVPSEIDYLKKIRKKNRMRILAAVLTVVIAAGVGIWCKAYLIGQKVEQAEFVQADVVMKDHKVSVQGVLLDQTKGVADVAFQEQDGIVTVSLRETLLATKLKELPVLLYLQGSPTVETATQNTESGRGASGCSFTKLSICSLNQNAFLPLKTTTRLPLHSMAALPTSWSNMSTFSIVQLILVLLLPCLHLSHR